MGWCQPARQAHRAQSTAVMSAHRQCPYSTQGAPGATLRDSRRGCARNRGSHLLKIIICIPCWGTLLSNYKTRKDLEEPQVRITKTKTPVREANAVRFPLSDILGKTELWAP